MVRFECHGGCNCFVLITYWVGSGIPNERQDLLFFLYTRQNDNDNDARLNCLDYLMS